MALHALDDIAPIVPDDGAYWVADNAMVVGNVELCENVSVWFNATIRGDNERIRIGEGSNVQDGCVLHTDPGFPLDIGANVTVGHMVMLHGCRIGANSLIGIGSIILNGAEIGEGSLIGAGALITEGKVIPPGSVVMGAPGRVLRETGDKERDIIRRATENYHRNWKRFAVGMSDTPIA